MRFLLNNYLSHHFLYQIIRGLKNGANSHIDIFFVLYWLYCNIILPERFKNIKLESERLKQLVGLMSKDNTLAFKEFFDILYPRFYRFAFHFIKSDSLAEEIVSDVFLKIWQNRKRLLFIEEIDAYFYKAIKNQSLTYLSKQARDKHDFSENSFSKLEYVQPENLMIAKELAEKIEEAISSLPERCEIIFRLIREDGLSYKHVAELLDISVKTVENQMGIAVKKLKVILNDFHNEPQLKNTIFSFLL